MTPSQLAALREIPLTKGKHTIVDEADYEHLSKMKWRITHNGYARHDINNSSTRACLFMHRIIMNCPDDMIIDHINGDKLDNRKCNLRLCTHNDNKKARNKPRKALGQYTSKYKGVCLYRKRWLAKLESNGKQHYIGMFATEKEAAIAYNNFALIYHGEFARLNIVED